MIAVLALETGEVYRGTAAGAEGEATGEVVFNTSLTGYQEILTDPSYAGQIVAMTCAEIGNTGEWGGGDRQLRRVVGGRRIQEAVHCRVHHPRRIADGEQLALRIDAARLSR